MTSTPDTSEVADTSEVGNKETCFALDFEIFPPSTFFPSKNYSESSPEANCCRECKKHKTMKSCGVPP